jgi:hypothetical protein
MPQPETDPVRAHSSETATQRLDRQRRERVTQLVGAPPAVVSDHLADLDRTWDLERKLEANAATW